MSLPSSNFAVYLRQHPGGRAGTARASDAAAPLQPDPYKRLVAEYPRGRGEHPFRVIHDALVHRPYGLHRVYVNGDLLGSQLSCPSADDCRAMTLPSRYESQPLAVPKFSPAVRAGKRGCARNAGRSPGRPRKEKRIDDWQPRHAFGDDT